MDSNRSLEEIFGSDCFSEEQMSKYLSAKAMEDLQHVRQGDCVLTKELAEEVAEAIKTWAVSKGATHYTHWFQPLTGSTAEKHDAFLTPVSEGKAVAELSAHELIQGESDASSFPSGGLRATFEARGYTAWDTTSPAFIRNKVLYIPTAFFSFNGEALDKKVPLIRSTQVLEKQTLRVLRALGNTSSNHITVNIGPEQEYFLVDKKLYDKRPDLRLAGRTVIGSFSARSQEMNDHYYGSICDKVSAFMEDFDNALWKVGITAKTEHQEAAPNQFELAVFYGPCNVTTDRNQLVMDTLKSMALKHGMVALLHEKPYAGVNGSGKHNNWSLCTDDGINLFSPGEDIADNLQFLLFLTSFLKAVDIYAPLIRSSVATAGNDHRLGLAEAPPTIISVYLGEALTQILESLSNDKSYLKSGRNIAADSSGSIKSGAYALPKLPKDLTDRNRTSPLAFTGNKFEFRTVGSSQSMAGPNIFINAAVASVLEEVADKLEAAGDKEKEAKNIICDYYKAHKRIIFNGNGYDATWVKEAASRGLPNYPDCVSALPCMLDKASVYMLTRQGVFSESELRSREEIYLRAYSKQINIEALTMVDMVRREIVPAISDYISDLSQSVLNQHDLKFKAGHLRDLASSLNSHLDKTMAKVEILVKDIYSARRIANDPLAQAKFYRDKVVVDMEQIRALVDAMESYTPSSRWPFPSYDEMLFTL